MLAVDSVGAGAVATKVEDSVGASKGGAKVDVDKLATAKGESDAAWAKGESDAPVEKLDTAKGVPILNPTLKE